MELYQIVLLIVGILAIVGLITFLNTALNKPKGEWEVIARGKGTGTFGSVIGGEYKVQVVAIIEQHTGTGKKRAYVKEPNGTKHDLDIDYAMSFMKDSNNT